MYFFLAICYNSFSSTPSRKIFVGVSMTIKCFISILGNFCALPT
jgi:hypothetical protein